MLAKPTIKSSSNSFIASISALSCGFFRFAPGSSLKKLLLARLLAGTVLFVSFSILVYPQSPNSFVGKTATLNKQNETNHLVEQIPKKFLERYNRWKEALLSVESGRRLWVKYAENPDFRLTIILTKDENQGAKVDDYQWENGKLVGVTINLGSQLDCGFPSMVNYPVLGSLAYIKEEWRTNGNEILAAAKFAHELGHVEHAASSNAEIYKLQNELSPIYAKRFLSNGHNQTDPVLKALATQMGGVPAQIKIERENWAETYALRYLLDKLKTKKLPELLKRVRKSIQSKFNLYSLPLQAAWSDLTSSGWETANSIKLE
jgi:hypothetical protein